MEKAIAIVVGVTITLIALANTMTGTFAPFKQNQALLNSSNNAMLGQLNAEISNSSKSTVEGSYIKSLMDDNQSNSATIIIKIDGSYTWNGKAYASCGTTINDRDQYTQQITVENGKTLYKFTKISA